MNFITVVFRLSLNPTVISVTIFNIIILGPAVSFCVRIIRAGWITVLVSVNTDTTSCKDQTQYYE